MKAVCWLLAVAAIGMSLTAALEPRQPPAATVSRDSCRSPVDIALLPGGNLALTANHTADSVSLIDLIGGRVLAEAVCGRKPAAVACSPDGTSVAVSNLWSGTLTLLTLSDESLRPLGEVVVGAMPRGLVFGHDGNTLYVALAGADEVVQVDWSTRRVTHRWPAPREPRTIAISRDGRLIAALSSRSGQVRCWKTETGQLLCERSIEDGFNLRGLVFAADDKSVICAHSVRRSFPVSKSNIEEGWVVDSRLTRFAMDAAAQPAMWQIALDSRGKAVGDPDGLALSDDGRWLAVAGSGTHEILLFDVAALPWNSGDPGDMLHPSLHEGDGKFWRIPVAGRPMRLCFLPRSRSLAVANYLLDAVQMVDLETKSLSRAIPLAAPNQPSLARQGETLFYDARLSRDQWFSCHTCHVDGHTCCLTFDTLNDDSYGNPKLTPTLRNVAATGPWTWHGWQKDLGAAVRKSIKETMFGPNPSDQEVSAIVAFLETLSHPPNPGGTALTPAKERGRAIFQGKARCIRCHQGENYTSRHNYDVGLEPDGSPYLQWNPPSLLGLWDRSPYLHDGRARTLEDLLDKHHGPDKLDGAMLTPHERHDLLEFLRSL